MTVEITVTINADGAFECQPSLAVAHSGSNPPDTVVWMKKTGGDITFSMGPPTLFSQGNDFFAANGQRSQPDASVIAGLKSGNFQTVVRSMTGPQRKTIGEIEIRNP